MLSSRPPAPGGPEQPSLPGRPWIIPLAIGLIAVAVIVTWVMSWHKVTTDPPPLHTNSLGKSLGGPTFKTTKLGYEFTENYYITVPCGKLSDTSLGNTDRLFIALFEEDKPLSSVSPVVRVNNSVRTLPVTLAQADYLPGTGSGCTADIRVQANLPKETTSERKAYHLVFYVEEHRAGVHEATATPREARATGSCSPSPLGPRLSYFRCLDGSNAHAADHTYISPIPIGE